MKNIDSISIPFHFHLSCPTGRVLSQLENPLDWDVLISLTERKKKQSPQDWKYNSALKLEKCGEKNTTRAINSFADIQTTCYTILLGRCSSGNYSTLMQPAAAHLYLVSALCPGGWINTHLIHFLHVTFVWNYKWTIRAMRNDRAFVRILFYSTFQGEV